MVPRKSLSSSLFSSSSPLSLSSLSPSKSASKMNKKKLLFYLIIFLWSFMDRLHFMAMNPVIIDDSILAELNEIIDNSQQQPTPKQPSDQEAHNLLSPETSIKQPSSSTSLIMPHDSSDDDNIENGDEPNNRVLTIKSETPSSPSSSQSSIPSSPSSSIISSSFMNDMMILANQNISEKVVRLDPKDCILVRTEDGIYSLQSEEENNMVCGLYLMALPNQLVEIEFIDFNVTCHKGGLLSVINGWEMMGQFFPSVEDHQLPRDARYHEFCGQKRPKQVFRMSQNVALIEYRIPTPGQGFMVRIRFVENPKPCNIVTQLNYGIYTLRNYGRRINCTISILFGAQFRILSMNVGQSYRRLDHILHSPRNYVVETGVIKKCKKRGMDDYVEFRGGYGLDTKLMHVTDDVCGFRQFPYKKRFVILCTHTAVRLVSSGQYDNQIEFSFETEDEIPSEIPLTSPSASKRQASYICPRVK